MTEITPVVELWKSDGIAPYEASKVVCSFLDAVTTSFGRATHYNTKKEQSTAELTVHDGLMGMSRDLYAALLLLPGTTDHARQIGIRNLLSAPRNGAADVFLNARLERELLVHLISELPPQRVFKLFDSFRGRGEEFGAGKANNARTRKLVLATLLGSKALELWAVKYRQKMIRVLTHVWGQRVCSIVGCVLVKDNAKWTDKEKAIIKSNVFKYRGGNSEEYVAECIGFALGKRKGFKLSLLKGFIKAKKKLEAGSKLPTEILEGIRSTYHPSVAKEEILKMKAATKTFTKHERKAVQKRATKAGVKVEMNPLHYDSVELYIYAFENGADAKVLEALDKKAEQVAAGLPVQYNRVGVVVDASESMAGDRTQKLRPLAVTLSLRDMLLKTADKGTVAYCGGDVSEDTTLVRPRGETMLAEGLLSVLKEKPDVVYVLSDGYENAPAGRFSDVLIAVRESGIETPVFHLNPVFAAETSKVRALCEDVQGISTMPVKSPKALGTTMIRGLVEADPERGINALVKCALKSCSNEQLALIGGAK